MTTLCMSTTSCASCHTKLSALRTLNPSFGRSLKAPLKLRSNIRYLPTFVLLSPETTYLPTHLRPLCPHPPKQPSALRAPVVTTFVAYRTQRTRQPASSKKLPFASPVSNCRRMSQNSSGCLKLSQAVASCFELSRAVSSCLTSPRAPGLSPLVAAVTRELLRARRNLWRA
eukprot:5520442-Pleurochrysis_carterae.AAC.4